MSNTETSDIIDPLTALAIRHGTDKWGPHFYTPLYHEVFSHLRDRPVRLLEIGVGGYDLKTAGGASLQMWAEYFSKGQITAIDIAEKRLILDPRVKLFQGSQDDPVFLQKVCEERGPFDIIIDDGSHVPKQVTTSFHILFPTLADGGIYIIEDVQTAFWPRFGGSIMHGGDTVKLVRSLIESLNHAEIAIVDQTRSFPSYAKQIKAFRAFHNLLVVYKGENSEPSNLAFDLNNPHAARALKTIEQAMESAPTAEGMANLIRVYAMGGNPVRAKEASEKAVDLWPTNGTLLMAAHQAAAMRGDTSAVIKYLEKILLIEPDNAVMQQTLKQAMQQAEAVPRQP
jgi:demethylmacrocin O-methyltransferase